MPIRIRQRSNFQRFQPIQNSTKVLSALLSNANLWKKSLFYDWFHMHGEPESADKPDFFLKFNLSHKLQLGLLNAQYNFCSVMCYAVLIWTLILLTLANSILLQSFNWPKPVHYVPNYNCLYPHSHSRSTNANFDQLRHITNSSTLKSKAKVYFIGSQWFYELSISWHALLAATSQRCACYCRDV